MTDTPSNATIHVQSPGLLSTLQDKGRLGLRHIGIPWSGALVPAWQQLANALVGNALDHCIIECFEGGLTLTIDKAPVRLALMAASDVQAKLVNGADTTPLKPAKSYTLQPGDSLTLSSTGSFRHAVIAILGLQASEQLGSASTYAKAGLGGIQGDALKPGSELHTSTTPAGREQECAHFFQKTYQSSELRVVLGPQDDHFSPQSIETFLSADYVLSTEVDRMGARLTGETLEHRDSAARDITSDAIVPGSIQVPGNGQPIILLNDAHTAGGYPKIATVISIDLPLLGLQRSGNAFQFTALSPNEAINAVREQASDLRDAIQGITPRKDFEITLDSLFTNNLIDGVTDGQLP